MALGRAPAHPATILTAVPGETRPPWWTAPATMTGWRHGRHATHLKGRHFHHPLPGPRTEDRAQLRGVGRGHSGVEGPQHGPGAHRAVLRRRDLPPDHPELHDPGRRPARYRHRRPGLHLRRRDLAGPLLRPPVPAS